MSLAQKMYEMVLMRISGTTSATVGTETTHAHNGGRLPLSWWIREKGAGVVYESKVADQTNIYVKGSIASIAFEAFIIF